MLAKRNCIFNRTSIFLVIAGFLLPVFLEAQPSNDSFRRRIPLGNGPTNVSGSVNDATAEPGENAARIVPPKASVWWSWVAPANGRVLLRARPTTPYSGQFFVGIFAGTALRRSAARFEGYKEASAAVEAGRPYAFYVDRDANTAYEFTLEVQFLAAPANDSFDSAETIAGPHPIVLGDNSGATQQPGEKAMRSYAAGATIWYSWIAPESGWAWVNARFTNDDHTAICAVHEGNSLRTLRTVLAPHVSWMGQNSGGFAATANRRYYVRVDGLHSADRGAVRLALDFTSWRISTPAEGTIVTDGTPFTVAASEPNPEIDGRITNAAFYFHNGSYSWLLGTDAEPPFSISASELWPGPGSLWVVGINDRGEQIQSPKVGIVVRPSNDNFENSNVQTGYHWSGLGDNISGTRERGEPQHTPSTVGNASVWLSWTAPASGFVQVYVDGTMIQDCLAIYTGSQVDKLKRVRRKRHGSPVDGFHYTFDAIRDVTYHFAVATDPYDIYSWAEPTSIHLTLSSVTLESPLDGARFREGSNIPLAVTTTEFQSEILGVEYYADGNLIASSLTPPYSTTWSNAPVGRYSVSARVRKSVGDEPSSYGSWVHIQPANDNFAEALVITNSVADLVHGLAGATREPGEPSYGSANPGNSVWWSWTAPADGRLILGQPTYSVPTPFFYIFTGSSVSNLTVVSMNWGGLEISALVQSNVTYHIAAGADYQPEVALRLRFYSQPINDAFANSIPLEGAEVTMEGNAVFASAEPGEPPGRAGPGQQSIWWHWTAPQNGFVKLERIAGLYWHTAVYEGGTLATLTPVASFVNNEFIVETGHTYRFSLQSYGHEEPIGTRLHFTAVPANDAFAAAVQLSGTNLLFDLDNRGATREQGEPVLPDGLGRTLWWSWTAPVEGNAYLKSQFLSGTGPLFAVYEGSAPATLVRRADGDFFRTASFRALAGHTYHFLADTIGGIFPAGLELMLVRAPDNDHVAAALTLTGDPVNQPGTVRGGSLEPGESPIGPGTDGSSVWFQWTCPMTTNFLITAPAFTLAVYDGVNPFISPRIGGQTHYDSLFFPAVVGRTYSVRVSSTGGAYTDVINNFFNFVLTIRSWLKPTNDFFRDAAWLLPGGGVVSTENWGATVEAGEQGVGFGNLRRTLWFRWRAAESGLFILTNLSPGGSPIANFYARAIPNQLQLAYQGHAPAEASFRAGTEVFIQTDFPGGAGGVIRFDHGFMAAPPNDDYANASMVNSLPAVLLGNTRAATTEPLPANVWWADGNHTIWWRWTAPANGTATLTNLAGSALFSVWTGSSLTNSTYLTSNTDGTDERSLTFSATAGTAYSIRAMPHSTNHAIELMLSFTEPTARANKKRNLQVQASTNLTHWETIEGDQLPHLDWSFLRQESIKYPSRFYRIIPAP